MFARIDSVPIQARITFRGFTLIELMVAVTILGILLAIAVPNFRDFLVNSRVTSQANDLVSDVLFARSEAAKRSKWIVVCPSTDGAACSGGADWATGRIVFVDLNRDGGRDAGETLLKAADQLSGTPVLNATGFQNTYITFSPYGGLFPSGDTGSVTICDASSANGRQVTIAVNGRPLATKVTC